MDVIPGVEPILIFLAGVQFIVLGAFLWHEKNKLRHRLQVAMIQVAGNLIQGAGNAAKMGSDFKVALEAALPQLPLVFKAIKDSASDS